MWQGPLAERLFLIISFAFWSQGRAVRHLLLERVPFPRPASLCGPLGFLQPPSAASPSSPCPQEALKTGGFLPYLNRTPDPTALSQYLGI